MIRAPVGTEIGTQALGRGPTGRIGPAVGSAISSTGRRDHQIAGCRQGRCPRRGDHIDMRAGEDP
jgi:hypothetical protein